MEVPIGAVPNFDATQHPAPDLTDETKAFAETKRIHCGLSLDHEHLKLRPKEAYEDASMMEALKDVDPLARLLELVGKKELFSEKVFHYAIGYDGEFLFNKPEQLTDPLTRIAKYAESDTSAAADIKSKLRYIVKMVCEAPEERLGALAMLAGHGNVCNVMKEIGIRSVYACLANVASQCSEDVKSRTVQLLYTFRETQLEKMYVAQKTDYGGSVDAHYITNYRNSLSEWIGLPVIPDPDIHNPYDVGVVSVFFARFYTIETIVDHMSRCINDAPRRLDYQGVCGFLRYNRPDKWPAAEADEFLFHCFDEAGRMTHGAVYWLLFKFGVFRLADGAQLDVDTLFPPLDEIRLSRSRENVLARSVEATTAPEIQLEDEMLRASHEHAPHCNHEKEK